MLLKGSLHDLGLLTDLPDTDLTFHTSGDDAAAVICGGKSGDTVVVRVVDAVQKTAGLGQESTDLTVVPSRDDATAIVHELDSEALEAWHFDTK